jgi:thiamine biosynthesis protein ThiS
MEIILNGEKRTLTDGLSVMDLVQQLGFSAERLAVELNLQIIKSEQWATSNLKEGDRIEIVQFVGGGNS